MLASSAWSAVTYVRQGPGEKKTRTRAGGQAGAYRYPCRHRSSAVAFFDQPGSMDRQEEKRRGRERGGAGRGRPRLPIHSRRTSRLHMDNGLDKEGHASPAPALVPLSLLISCLFKRSLLGRWGQSAYRLFLGARSGSICWFPALSLVALSAEQVDSAARACTTRRRRWWCG